MSTQSANTSTFVGRTSELEEIRQTLSKGEHGVLVHGIGGTGKTELAHQFCYRYHKEYPIQYWVDAGNEYSMRRKLLEIAESRGLPTKGDDGGPLDIAVVIDQVLDAFPNDTTLLVMDNIVDVPTFASWLESARLKASRMPHILATSQSADQRNEYFHTMELKELPEHLAMQFLKSRIPPSLFNVEEAKKNIKTLGCLPLALEISVAYIRRKEMTIESFNKLIGEDSDLMYYRNFPPNYGKPMYVAFNNIIQKVLESGTVLTNTMMYVMALMDGQQIEKEFVSKSGGTDEVNHSLVELITYSVIRKQNEVFTMHALVQKTIQNRLVANDEEEKYVGELLRIMSSVKETHTTKSHTSYGDVWVHHLILLIERYADNNNIMEMLEDEKKDLYEALINKGDYKTAMTCLRVFLNAEQNSNRPFDIIWWTLNEIADCLRCVGNYVEAVDEYRDLNERCKEEYGEEGRNTLKTMNDLANCMCDQGEYTEARKMFEHIYSVQKRVIGEENPSTLITMYNIARLLEDQGEYAAAHDIIRQVYEKRKNILGECHPDTVDAKETLDSILNKLSENKCVRACRNAQNYVT